MARSVAGLPPARVGGQRKHCLLGHRGERQQKHQVARRQLGQAVDVQARPLQRRPGCHMRQQPQRQFLRVIDLPLCQTLLPNHIELTEIAQLPDKGAA
ncbi:MAG: hypothetical protein K6T26_07195 [Alicyclobacillus sp.]|nr:hypothetical protein [Alicyclobacillus sp.]